MDDIFTVCAQCGRNVDDTPNDCDKCNTHKQPWREGDSERIARLFLFTIPEPDPRAAVAPAAGWPEAIRARRDARRAYATLAALDAFEAALAVMCALVTVGLLVWIVWMKIEGRV